LAIAGLLRDVVRKTIIEDLSPGYGHLLRRWKASQAAITLNNTSFPICYGPEFSSKPFKDWLVKVGIKPI
jgi:hypothetical protein